MKRVVLGGQVKMGDGVECWKGRIASTKPLPNAIGCLK